MNEPSRGLGRTTQILRFLLKYRSAGVFTGLDLESATVRGVEQPPTEGKPEQFVDDLEAMGPTFVKIGQALSTRPDMVPAPYITALERMQDDVAPIPFEQVRAVVEESLGAPIHELFASFDPHPLGCASLAQVHGATLHDGSEVAVKVQRPGIVDLVRADLDAIASLADKADRHTEMGRRVHFSDWVHEFRKTLLAELDYRAEAENLERFGEHLCGYPELLVPRPWWDLTSTRVLTMDRVRGSKVTELGEVQRREQDLNSLADALMRGYLDQVFVHGEIHADPHPGNLLVTHDGRLALFDLGMIAHVPPKQRERLLKLLFAAVDGRGEEVANETIAMGTRLECFDEERFMREVGQMVARYAAHSHRTSQSEGRLMLELVSLSTACGLRSPPELSLLGKTLLNLEQVADLLDPELDVKSVVDDHLDHVMRERLKRSFSPSNIASELIEVQGLLREAPRKISDLLALLAENRMQVRVDGIADSQLMESLQKIANRIAAGLVTAALIVASAMMMRVDSGFQVLGYPAIALVLFLVGAVLGLMIVTSALLGDHKARPREERGPR